MNYKKLIKNNHGSISSIVVLIILILLALSFIHYFTIAKVEKKLILRTTQYLCLRSFTAKTDELVTEVKRVDEIIKGINFALMAASFKPPLRKALEIKKKSWIQYANIIHNKYLLGLINPKTCKMLRKKITSPYSHLLGQLKRDQYDLSQFKSKYYFFILGKSFSLWGYKAFKKDEKWLIHESPAKKDLSFLRHSFGAL